VRAFAEQQHWICRAVHVHGHAAQEIVRIAEAGKYDLIVMGSHGHTSLGNVILGSVASGMLALQAAGVAHPVSSARWLRTATLA
jgi:nucleotide-binding universal stress UspA family protein